MKFKNPLLVVKDIKNSTKFYKEVLGLNVIIDFGANVTLTGGVCLQTEDTWKDFINNSPILYGNNDAEIYFEEDNFDTFIEKLNTFSTIQYVHQVIEHSWGQRVVRFYDLDNHIIEVGENLKTVCKRFVDSGMTIKEVAKKMDIPEKFISLSIK
ncbi:MAG: glyoxalase [Clostridia bacterium]|nr:glyoxalase [Clostridia bacterium]